MLKYYIVKEVIEEIAPLNLQEAWDNSGTQIFTGKEDISSVLTALELTQAVVDEAIVLGVDMVVTHHPLIFNPLKSIDFDTPLGKLISQLIAADINVYAAHTSFDKAPKGNNYDLASRLQLSEVEPLVNPEGESLIGGVGNLPFEMSVSKLRSHVSEALEISETQIRVVSATEDESIMRIGYCTGAGAEFVHYAALMGCDAYITGDVKYHEAQNALAEGIVLVDAGHYGTEWIFFKKHGLAAGRNYR